MPPEPTSILEVPLLRHYRDRVIPQWIDDPKRGARYEFNGVATETADGAVSLDQLGPDEIIVAPGLIDRRQT